MLIGIGGAKRVGKDTAGEYLTKYGYERVGFADQLKDLVEKAFEMPYRIMYADEIKDLELKMKIVLSESDIIKLCAGIKEMGLSINDDQMNKLIEKGTGTQFKSFRHILQYVGTDLLREHYSQTIWIDMLDKKIEGKNRIVITDMRFPDERKYVSKKGGTTLLITRMMDVIEDTHSSENLLGDPMDYDKFITNNGTIAELHDKLGEFVEVDTPPPLEAS